MRNAYISRINSYLEKLEEITPQPTGIEPIYSFDNSIKAVIFDIYGTLLISESGDLDRFKISNENLYQALRGGGFTLQKPEFGPKILEFFISKIKEQHALFKQQGHPYPEVDIVKVWRDVVDESLTQKWIKTSRPVNVKLLTIVFELLSNKSWPMPYLKELINLIKSKSIPMGVVSNAQFYTPIIMNHFIDGNYYKKEFINGFDENLSIFSYKIFRSKPDTKLFELLADALKRKYSLLPNQVLFVGNDMHKDIWTASQLGFKTALFAGDKRSLKLRSDVEECKNLKPDFILTDLKQLVTVLGL